MNQEQEVKVTETRIVSLKLTVAGIPNTSTTNTPTGSWASTTQIPGDFSEMVDTAVTNFIANLGHTGDPGENVEDDKDPKRQRKAVEISPTDINVLWNVFQESIAKHAGNLAVMQHPRGQEGEQDVVMRASGE